MFGRATASQITLSMPSRRKIVLWATVLTPLLKFALILSPLSEAKDLPFWPLAFWPLPYFNYVVALIGSLVVISICLILPSFYMAPMACKEDYNTKH
ncbi:hypothetical protein KP509_04G055400 [Ceratopteris richardii]|nr:hypothetical protein KP509_04G055400 [Ceratopteris richardii]